MSDRARAEKIFKNKRNYIRSIMEEKIDIYEPLDVEAIYREFREWVQDEEFKVIREIPADYKVFIIGKILPVYKVKAFLNDLIKNFLIERAYYVLAERLIRKRIMKRFDISDPNDIRVLEIADFIMKELEADNLSRLKKFAERSKFKYFMGIVVTHLLFDFLRVHYKTKKNVTTFAPEFDALFERPVDGPYDLLIKFEDEGAKKKAAEILPQILENLGPEEKLAIQWKYKEGMSTSATARALGISRYKTEKFIENLEYEISKKIVEGTASPPYKKEWDRR
jgi:RNA polymerase sigma factor (sigma-70 family)